MVERKTNFFPKAQGRRTRLCFTRDKVTLTLKTPSKDDQGNILDNNTIELYPNYQIIEGEVQTDTRLPSDYQVPPEDLQNLPLNLTFTSTCSFQKGEISPQSVESISRSVVQVHFFSFKNPLPMLMSATGTLIENSNRCMILSCLHVLMHSGDPSEYLILVTAEEDDNHHDFKSLMAKFRAYLVQKAKASKSKKDQSQPKSKKRKNFRDQERTKPVER